MKNMEKHYNDLRTDGGTYCDGVDEAEHLQCWAIENIKVDPFTKLPVRRVKAEPKFFDGKWRTWVTVSY